MESCTGGGLVNTITNIEGASNILKFSAVTYSNEYKIKMNVPKEIIDKYSVYSMETAKEMSKNIANYANANYGIGITGKLQRKDENNPYGKDNIVFISIYNKDENQYNELIVEAIMTNRKENKELVIENIVNRLYEIINE